MRTSLKSFDAVVAGAGIWGCTVARMLADSGQQVLVVDKRDSIGGNCRCSIDEDTGIEVHLYGSHIFHTRNREVWDFINRFTEFNGYQHRVLSEYNGRIYQLPIGLNLVNKFFGVELKPAEMISFLDRDGHKEMVFDAFIRGYTSKQWGISPEQVDKKIIERLKFRTDYNTNYFDDYWQGIPSDGYNEMFRRMLDSPRIRVECGTKLSLEDFEDCKSIYYSGAIDELFGYKYGALPWRSLRFETTGLDVSDYQGSAVVNYPELNIPHTRIHEYRHYHPEPGWKWNASVNKSRTIITREYPEDWEIGKEAYYPIASADSEALADRYREEASYFPRLVIGGRLGRYRYLDIDQTILDAMQCVQKKDGENSPP